MSQRTLFFPDTPHVRRVMAIHFDPELGTPYWLERDRRLGLSSLRDVATFEELKASVGFRDLEEQRRFEHDARTLPLERFIPRSALREERFIWAAQTGGTSGAPKHGSWGARYWDRVLALSDEMLDLHDVPRDRSFLYVGPTGPHTTGRLAIAMAERRGGRCFSIDLDPRIVKVLAAERMQAAYERYLRHIWDQVAPILASQDVGVLFTTSRLLEMMPERVDVSSVTRLAAIVHAGTTMSRDSERILREELFPRIPIVGIYGTSITGVSFQKPPEPGDDHRVIYIPSAPHVVLEVVDAQNRVVEYGEAGRVATYRLTLDALIPGLWARDVAVRARPAGAFAELYPWDWIEGPFSPELAVEGKVEGVY
jgi:thienamycin biosynthesis protein ThnN